LENRLVPANVSWIVNGDGFWDLGSNWSTGIVPGPQDDVTINQPGPLTVTVRDAEAVHSVQTSVHDSLALTGGSFAVGAASQLDGAYLQSGGTLNASGPLTLTSANSQWANGTVSGSVTNQGTLTLIANADSIDMQTLTGTLTNSGTVIDADPNTGQFPLQFTNGTLNNQAGSLIDFQTDTPVGSNGQDTINNAGTLLKSAGAGSTNILVPIKNSGAVNVASGTLRVSGDLSNPDTITIASGSILAVGGKYLQTASGTIHVEIGGAPASGQFSRLAVRGTAMFDGTIHASLLKGFQPVLGNSFPIFTFASSSGDFVTRNGFSLGGDLTFSESFGPASLSLVVSQAITNCTSPSGDFLTGLYRDVLERSPDASGFGFWTQRLDAGMTRTQVAENFLASVEYLGLEVDRFYATFFHRSADVGGRGFWVTRLAAGVSASEVAAAFLTSLEYTTAHAAADSFVSGLFTDVLGHSGGAQMAAWQQLLQNGVLSRTQAALVVLTSDEAYMQAINENYLDFLGRPVDPAVIPAFLAAASAGQLSPVALSSSILGSAEYLARQMQTDCTSAISPG